MSARDPGAWLTILPPLAPAAYLQRPHADLPFPLAEPSFRLFAMARQALWQGVQAAGLQRGDEVVVPALHHGSEVEALIRAGLTPRFHDVGEDGGPREDELESLLTPRTRALYLIHTLGLPQDASRWRRWCDDRGLLLIEDAAMAWLGRWEGRPVGSFGDVAIFCLYKTVPVPDGGALVGPAAPAPASRRRAGAGRLARRHASWVAQRSRRLARRMSETYDPVYRPTAARNELGDAGSPASVATAALLPRLADPSVAQRRNDNYRRLLDALGDRAVGPFRELPPGASPFGFPMDVDDTTRAVRHFADHGVHGTHLWPIGHPSLPTGGAHPHAELLRERTVTLPVHQGLREQDLERIVAAARSL